MVSDVNSEGFDAKMLFIQVTQLQPFLNVIDGLTIHADPCSVMISSITVKRRSGLGLKQIGSLVEIEFPSLKKEPVVATSSFEDDDDGYLIRDHHDLEKFEDMAKQSSLPSLPSKSMVFSRPSEKKQPEEKSEEMSPTDDTSNQMPASVNK